MTVQFTAQAEPIPGYKLLEPLGRGGFGEVWKAEAPGGLLKAIKLINGSLRCGHGGEVLVQQELKSLDRVKQVRHPYVLSMDRFDIIDGQLLIVMELADHSVWDRFSECTKKGLPGIPRDELLRYMDEAAEALDVMSQQFGLQHADIKPQNLFLVHHHVKVADFGLVKDLKDAKVLDAACFSPLYGAPETFEGRISPQSDQYSLAIVYQELLTGVRPLDGKNPRQLLMQHMQGEPNVAPLPPAEQAIIRRALAKKPEERFDSCGILVRALRAAGLPKKAIETHTKMKRPGLSASGVLAKPSAPGTTVKPDPLTGSHPGYQRAISVACPGCGYQGQVPKQFVGKDVKCRECGRAFPVSGPLTAVSVPALAAPPAPPVSPSPPPVVEEVVSVIQDTATGIRVCCAVCGNTGRVPEETAGRRFRCNKCGCVQRV